MDIEAEELSPFQKQVQEFKEDRKITTKTSREVVAEPIDLNKMVMAILRIPPRSAR